jgi:hypothetical protein
VSVSYHVSEKVLTAKTVAYCGLLTVTAQLVDDIVGPRPDLPDQSINAMVRAEGVCRVSHD